MKTRSVIIVGGGIGGLALARFLVLDGHHVQVVERATDFSAQGHSIGIRGVGLQAMVALGLRERVARTGLNHRAATSYLMNGLRLRSTPYSAHGQAVGGIVVTQRGRLHAALQEQLPPQIGLRFGVRPQAIRQDATSVTLTLSDGSTLRGDVLIGADGANSQVRGLVAPDLEVIDRGLYVGMTIAAEHGLPVDEVASFYGVARMVIFFPLSAAQTAAVVYQDGAYPAPAAGAPAEAWREYLATAFRGAAAPVRRNLAALKPGDDIFQDRIRQVRPRRAAMGRVALLGDAGYCASFFSGNGAGIATAGAYCLARALARNDDDVAALKDYERRILPFVAEYHANADRLRETLFTRSPLKIAARTLALALMTPAMASAQARRHYRGEVRLADLAC